MWTWNPPVISGKLCFSDSECEQILSSVSRSPYKFTEPAPFADKLVSLALIGAESVLTERSCLLTEKDSMLVLYRSLGKWPNFNA